MKGFKQGAQVEAGVKSQGSAMGFKMGGQVSVSSMKGGNAAMLRGKPTNELDAETGGKTPLRPGFKKGGKIAAKKVGKKMKGGKAGC